MLTLIGYEMKQGSFSDERSGRQIDFDNIELHVMADEFPQGKEAKGQPVDRIKIKRADFEKFVGNLALENLIGHSLTPIYTIYNGKPVLDGLSFK